MAVASLVLGIVALVTSILPIINNLSFLLAILGIVFAIVGLVGISKGKKSGKGLGVAGLVLSVIAFILVLVMQSAFSAALDQAMEESGLDTATAQGVAAGDSGSAAEPQAAEQSEATQAAYGVTIDDCENLSRRMDKILDEADPISQSYYFEVSSPGIGRDLVRPWHFERYLGEQIEVKLIRPMQLENGSSLREFVAPLCSCDDQTITVELDGQQLTIEKKDAAYIRLYEQISFK